MPIQLKPLTVNDFQIYQNFYKLANYEGYQTNFHSLMLWNAVYHTQFYYNDHFLITFMHYNGIYFWNMPLTTPERFKEAVDAIIEYCDEHKIPFFMDAILHEQEELLKSLYPNRFIFRHSADNQSYIYEADSNKTLSGKKMQKRRNHFNAFIKEYSNRFKYRIITKEDKDEISKLYDYWAEDKEDYALEFEKKGVLNMMDELNTLNHKMACIEIDGKIQAFILGSLLNHNTVQIHVEKANKEIRGLYVAILKFFLESEFDDVLYVNREEDMGIESLRKAKLQLHPVYLLDQSFAHQKKSMIIRKANEDDAIILKERWLTTFKEDTEAFYDEYLKKSELDIYVLENDYQIISAVYLRKMKLEYNHSIKNAYYIEGVSTHHMYQGNGYMKQLLSEIVSRYRNDILLIQAYDWTVYNSFQFDGIINKELIELNESLPIEKQEQVLDGINENLFKNLYESYSRKYDTKIIRDLPIDIKCYEGLYHKNGYLLYTRFNEKIVVTEIIYHTREDAIILINELINRYGRIKLLCENDLMTGETIVFAKYFKNQIPDTKKFFFNEYI